MSSKLFWFDTETTGLDPQNCAIWQLACLIEIDGQVVDEFDLKIAPFAGCKFEDGAQALQDGRKLDWNEMQDYPSLEKQIATLKRKLARFVNKYDRSDKFVPCGYNVNFDLDFLRAAFFHAGDKYFGSWIFWAPVDVRSFVGVAVGKYGMRFKNYKLKTICDEMRIPLDAHDALSDIKATRDLYELFKPLR